MILTNKYMRRQMYSDLRLCNADNGNAWCRRMHIRKLRKLRKLGANAICIRANPVACRAYWLKQFAKGAKSANIKRVSTNQLTKEK